MNISHAHVDLDDAHVAMSGLPGEHQGSNFTFQHRVLLIHIGKAGGATVNRMLSDANVTWNQVHVHPVPRIAIASHARIVACVRDPVDRLISAYKFGIEKREEWALRLANCFDVNQFAVEFAYHRINPSLRRRLEMKLVSRLNPSSMRGQARGVLISMILVIFEWTAAFIWVAAWTTWELTRSSCLWFVPRIWLLIVSQCSNG